jgi:hypothetical protein
LATFRDPAKLSAHIKKALDFQMAETLISTQAGLGSASVSPVDTGRLRSSWFAAEGNASNAEAPEGANSASTDAEQLRVDSKRNYHLTNNLVYAQRVALEGHVKNKPITWFRDFRDQVIPKIQAEAARQAKREFDL